jgi:hypothetical protein
VEFVMALMILVALAAAGLGLLFSSQATVGVSLVAIACLAGIFARIAQASLHRKSR